MGEATRTATPAWKRPEVVERLEQVLVAILFCFLTWRVLHSANVFAPLLLVSEALVVILILIRRPSEHFSVELGDWLVALTGTCAPLLVVPVEHRFEFLVPMGVTLFAFGLVFQVLAKVSLNRSLGLGPANRGIKHGGVYRLVRHPMYAGYIANNIGLLLLMFSFANFFIYLIGWTAQIMRIRAEERLLSLDPAYQDYMEQVHWRLLPGIW